MPRNTSLSRTAAQTAGRWCSTGLLGALRRPARSTGPDESLLSFLGGSQRCLSVRWLQGAAPGARPCRWEPSGVSPSSCWAFRRTASAPSPPAPAPQQQSQRRASSSSGAVSWRQTTPGANVPPRRVLKSPPGLLPEVKEPASGHRGFTEAVAAGATAGFFKRCRPLNACMLEVHLAETPSKATCSSPSDVSDAWGVARSGGALVPLSTAMAEAAAWRAQGVGATDDGRVTQCCGRSCVDVGRHGRRRRSAARAWSAASPQRAPRGRPRHCPCTLAPSSAHAGKISQLERASWG